MDISQCISLPNLDCDIHIIAEKFGDLPIMETKVDNEGYVTILEKEGLILQDNIDMRFSRIIDSNNMLKAVGSKSVMLEKFKRITREEFLEPGDVVGVCRSLYNHMGIYIGNNEIVHFADKDKKGSMWNIKDWENKRIHRTSLDSFLKDESNYFVLYFEKGKEPRRILRSSNCTLNDSFISQIPDCLNENYDTVFSPKNVVRRALFKVEHDYEKYDLFFNNCEHFAIWCKTGKKQSSQIGKIATLAAGALVVATACKILDNPTEKE